MITNGRSAAGRLPAARLAGVDALRGLAAMAVCWFHFTNGNPAFLTDGWLKRSGAFGWLGVDVFFVISGFIVPYSMSRRGYVLSRDAASFIVRRVVRLDPPYLAAASMSLCLWYASWAVPGFRGVAPNVSAAAIAAHVGYLNGLLGLPWLNPVFWSLAIEFQFYLSIALIFPVLAHARAGIRWAGLAAVWIAAMLVPSPVLIFHFLALFGCGLACFQFHDGRFGWGAAVGLLSLMGLAGWFTVGPPSALVAVATALVILWGRGGSPLGSWLGRISYSLYLVHVPIGGRIVNAGTRFADSAILQGLVLLAAVAGSMAAAVVLNRLVEQPALRWSATLGDRLARRAPLPALAAPPA